MCQKVIAVYQQTFKNNDEKISFQYFKFQRIYKTKPEQYFRIKCISFSNLVDTRRVGEMFLSPGFGKCNYQSVGATTALSSDSNDMYLGTFADSFAEYCMMDFLMDDIPLSTFKIYNSAGSPGRFLVSFQIELLED
jgi:hypothetical protein